MKHILFALFENQEAATKAIDDLEHEGIPRDCVSFIVHKDRLNEDDLALEESDARPALGKGVLIGGAAGVVLGLLLAGPFGLFGAGPLAAALFGAGAGSLYGALGGALSGAGLTDAHLDKLASALKQGRILVTAQTEGREVEAAVIEIFERHGAIESTKTLQ